eukprot:scaffold51357_cov20-Tisochrysis_lutea.AAC.1
MISCAHARHVTRGGPLGSPPVCCVLTLGRPKLSRRSNAEAAALLPCALPPPTPPAVACGEVAAAAAAKQWCRATSSVQHTSE